MARTPEEIAADEAAAAAAVASAAHTVPVTALTAERRKTQEVAAELEELKAWKAEQEAKDQSEADRHKARAEKAEAEVAALRKTTAQERTRNLIADAATAANFHNPRAAAALLDAHVFSAIDGEAAAKAAVAELAAREGYLVKPATPAPQGVEKILADGRPVVKEGGEDEDTSTFSQAEFDAMSPSELADVMRDQPDKFARSVDAEPAKT